MPVAPEQEKQPDTFAEVDLAAVAEGEVCMFWYHGNQFTIEGSNTPPYDDESLAHYYNDVGWKFSAFRNSHNGSIDITLTITSLGPKDKESLRTDCDTILISRISKDDPKNPDLKGLGGKLYEKVLYFLNTLQLSKSFLHQVSPEPNQGTTREQWDTVFVPILEQQGYTRIEDDDVWEKAYPALGK